MLSRAMQEYFCKTYHRETVIIPNGMDHPVLREAGKNTKKVGASKGRIYSFCGKNCTGKRTGNAYLCILKTATEKKLVIAGGISDTRNFYRMLQRMAQADTRILFTDFVQKEELEELYSL